MKIVKEGKKPANEWQVECSKCGCIFVFDNRDVKSDQREGDWVHCPTCNDAIDVTHRRFWKNDSAIKDSSSKTKELNLEKFSEDFQKMMEQYGVRILKEADIIFHPYHLEYDSGEWTDRYDGPIAVRDITMRFTQIMLESDNDFISIVKNIHK